ncbi:MAG TPA: hypothetical protein VI703_05630 [Anaerolineales bacterium]|jgi:hypothetical protein|nr:hypothetical protein [Anaerolineales bacterium]
MGEEKILTKHPDKNKSGKRISKEKYDVIKQAMLSILSGKELTHIQLFDNLEAKLAGKFDGNISWYGETIKLDLEARKIIERTKSQPVRYRLK